MKTFFIGLILGLAIAGLAGYLLLPDIKHTAHDAGFTEGNKKGIETGTTEGITKGIAQIKAEEKRVQDSISVVQKNLAAQRKAALIRKEKEVKPIQNWHVIDGKIDDPVMENIPSNKK